MATPHLAGAAAVVRGLKPGWTAAQVRSAVVNTIASGSGGQRTASMTLTNLATTTRTFTVAVADDGADGVTFATSGGSFTLAPGASQAVKLTVTSTSIRGVR